MIVATPERPTDEILSAAMQPFHEFECTGEDDQYVQEINKTEEVRADYLKGTSSKIRIDGQLFDSYDERFYRDPTEEESKTVGMGSGCGGGLCWRSKDWGDGRGYRAKVKFVPENGINVEVPYSELMSFVEYVVKHEDTTIRSLNEALTKETKYGYAVLSATGEIDKVIRRTNPNDKWDYWRIGGRYTGKLKGCDGLQAEASWEWSHGQEKRPDGYDIIRKSDIDQTAMKAARIADRQKWADECCSKANVTFEELEVAIAESKAAHKIWVEVPEPRPRGGEYHAWEIANGFPMAAKVASKNWELPDPKDGQTIREWINDAPWLTSFAFLRDGKWASEGDMGWWACVSNANPCWPDDFQSLIADVPDDWFLTVLDCHI